MKAIFFNFLFLLSITTSFGQFVINELMIDPNPAVGLPESEFIELYNVSDEPVDLMNWTISDATSREVIQLSILVPKGEYVLLVDEDSVDEFSSLGTIIALDRLPSLNNSGDQIRLINPDAILIDEVNYSSSWYKNPLKSNGGWSLERINPKNTCDLEENWAASEDSSGGSPAHQNSIFNPDFFDQTELSLLGLSVQNDRSVQVNFSKPVDSISMIESIEISPNVNLQSLDAQGDKANWLMQFSEPMEEGQIYTIRFNQLLDCARLTEFTGESIFGIPQEVESGDIVVNEILFNPNSGGVDFIELINRSSKLVTMENWTIAEADITDSTDVVDFVRLENFSRLIQPNEIVAFTSNIEVLNNQYDVQFPNQLVEVAIPNYPDKEGMFLLLNQNLEQMEWLHYNENWHNTALSRVDGVSLERIDVHEPSQSKANWNSASFQFGFATPGFENSQQITTTTNEDEIELSGRYFTPDFDGVNDVLTIRFQTTEIGTKASLAIYTTNGQLVRHLINNQIIGASNSFAWQGYDDEGNELPIGHYIIVLEIVNEQGVQEVKRSKVVLSRKSR